MGVSYVSFTDVDMESYDAVVVGCGFAGAVTARELAERGGLSVLVIEKRAHIGGNMYDEPDNAGILVHRYGPHIFHTNDRRVFDYVRRFTAWRDYQHEVLADWYGTYLPVPFNENSLEIAFGSEKAARLTDKLVETFGDGSRVTITQLREQEDPDLTEIADFVYENVFLHYTQKQWGLTPEEVDPSVTARVPVLVSRDNRYFQDAYQGMPRDGYTPLFERMLDHERIAVCLNTDAEQVFDLEFVDEAEDSPLAAVLIKGRPFTGHIVYTGPVDELFCIRFGRLPYRSLRFEYQTYEKEHVLPCATVNCTVTGECTRMTEFTYLTGQKADRTTVMSEYSLPYTNPQRQIPYYAIIDDQNRAHYERYARLVEPLANFHLLGRLAEYRYYNMDVIIGRALALADELIGR